MAHIVSITSQGQISIPAPIRRKLGLNQISKAIVSEKDGRVIIEPAHDLLELSGSLKTKKKPLTGRQIHEMFAKHQAKEVVGRSK